jgi:ribose transport system permease protein
MSQLEHETPSRRSFDWRSTIETFGPLLALVLLVVVTSIIEHSITDNPRFLSAENWLNILRQNAFVGIVAIGMTFVIIAGGIDLSVGSLVAMSAGLGMWLMNCCIGASKYIAENKENAELNLDLDHSAAAIWFAKLFQSLGIADQEHWGVTVAIAATLLIGALAGTLSGLIIAKGRIAPFIATLGLLAIYRSVIVTVAEGAEIRSASKDLFPAIGTQGFDLPFTEQTFPWTGLIFFLIAALAAYLLNRTRFGRYVFAIGSNERAAVYSAIRVDRVKIWTYTLMGATCGVAAWLFASRVNSVSTSRMGELYELDAIAAVVIGGTRLSGGAGTIRGTIVGVLVLAVINNMLNMLDVSSHPQGMVKGAIIIAAALLQQVGRKN